MACAELLALSFSTIQYNTTVKLRLFRKILWCGFSTIQYNTTVKLSPVKLSTICGFSTIQYNTTVKPHMCGFTEVNVVALT